MHMVVIAPDDHVVLQNVFRLEFVERVFGQVLRIVAVVPEGVLMRDHHVQARGVRAFEHVESRHHRRGDALDGRIRVSDFERVPVGPLVPRCSLVLSDQLDDFTRSHQAGLQ